MKRTEIQLRCHGCGLTVVTPRDVTDPLNAVFIEDWCPECGNGGFDQPEYFDADGMQIMPSSSP